MARLAFAAACLLGVLLLAAPAASAAQRFADPAGTGTTCSQASPCDVVVAVNNAGNNDEVILASGTYHDPANPANPIPTKLLIDNPGQVVHGTPGAQRPVLVMNVTGGFPAVQLSASGAELRDVEVQDGGDGPAVLISVGRADRIVATNSTAGGGIGCQISDATLTNSVCRATSSSNAGLAARELFSQTGTGTMRNVTAVSTTPGGVGIRVDETGQNATATLNATNVIAQGGTGAGSADVATSTSAATGTANLVLDHSNYDTVAPHSAGPGTESATPAGTGGNQTPAPVLAADFHQLPGSPTIDAGVNDPANGSLDFDGGARQVCTTDIGADEFGPVTCPAVASTGGAAGGAGGGGSAATGGGAITPSNIFTFAGFVGLPDGTGEIVLGVPGAGTAVAEDAGKAGTSQLAARRKRRKPLIKPVRRTAAAAGAVILKIRPSPAGKVILRRQRRLSVRIRVTFTPRGGRPRSNDRRVTLRLKRGH